jgi:hypothetical protein
MTEPGGVKHEPDHLRATLAVGVQLVFVLVDGIDDAADIVKDDTLPFRHDALVKPQVISALVALHNPVLAVEHGSDDSPFITKMEATLSHVGHPVSLRVSLRPP